MSSGRMDVADAVPFFEGGPGIVGQIHKCLQGNSREEGYSLRIDPSPTCNSSEMQEPGGCCIVSIGQGPIETGTQLLDLAMLEQFVGLPGQTDLVEWVSVGQRTWKWWICWQKGST